jgi:hypothetical protein
MFWSRDTLSVNDFLKLNPTIITFSYASVHTDVNWANRQLLDYVVEITALAHVDQRRNITLNTANFGAVDHSRSWRWSPVNLYERPAYAYERISKSQLTPIFSFRMTVTVIQSCQD